MVKDADHAAHAPREHRPSRAPEDKRRAGPRKWLLHRTKSMPQISAVFNKKKRQQRQQQQQQQGDGQGKRGTRRWSLRRRHNTHAPPLSLEQSIEEDDDEEERAGARVGSTGTQRSSRHSKHSSSSSSGGNGLSSSQSPEELGQPGDGARKGGSDAGNEEEQDQDQEEPFAVRDESIVVDPVDSALSKRERQL